ncbi:hypothetical protein [Coleofasciculus sp.]
MTFSTIVALFSAMVVLASIPSVSVLTVSTRSATSGFIHGVFTTLGSVFDAQSLIDLYRIIMLA